MRKADRRTEYQEALAAAAAEMRAAAAALDAVISPDHPDWHPAYEDAYRARFDRWRAASKELVEALDRLAREQAGRS